MSHTASLPPAGGDNDRKTEGEVSDGGVIQTSRYVADICGELSVMAKSAKLLMLSYLLGMAKLEAERIARGRPPK